MDHTQASTRRCPQSAFSKFAGGTTILLFGLLANTVAAAIAADHTEQRLSQRLERIETRLDDIAARLPR